MNFRNPFNSRLVIAKERMNSIHSLFVATVSIFALGALSACGGGGGGSSNVDQVAATIPPLPPPEVMATSSGDMTKYLGSWSGECGTTFASLVRSVRNYYTIAANTAAAASGVLEQYQFSDTSCMTAYAPSGGFPIKQSFTITYIGNVAVPKATSISDNFVGFVDKVSYAIAGSSAAPTTQYVGFSTDFRKFRIHPEIPNSNLIISYSK